MDCVSLEGVSIAYEDVGRGPALTLVHGHPFDRSMWGPQVDHFSASGWRVITPDLRGYGDSDVVPGTTTLETFAGDIAGLLDHLAVRKTVIGGLSMGGQVVMEFQRLFPDRVRALMFADTSAHAETEAGKGLRRGTADRLVHQGMAQYADEVLSRMVAPATIRHLPDVAQHVLGMMSGTSPAGAAAALRGRADRLDYVEMLTEIRVPTLVVVGQEDDFTPIEDARLIQEQVPDATLVVIEGAGHLPNLERPAEFNAALERLLDTLAIAD